MGIFDKAKDATKKGLDKGVDLGKKGVDGTKEAVRKKTCSECKHYNVKDDVSGSCQIAGDRMASADSATCPQKAFEAK